MQKKSIIIAENLSYELSLDRTLFAGVQANIEIGDRIALIGTNGVGKSTLLKIFAGQISPTGGSISRHGSIYYLPQVSTISEEIKAATVLDF